MAGIPAYNEEATIAKTIVRTRKYVHKVIVVDDGSEDDTAIIAESLGATVFRHVSNKGKGEALGTLFKVARRLRADVLVTLDADAQHDPSEIPKLVHPVTKGSADIVIGARRTPGSVPAVREAGQRLLDMATAVRDNDGSIVDSQSGFRAYSKKAMAKLSFREPGMGVESESLRRASSVGLIIKQVPVTVKYGGTADHTLNPLMHFTDVMSAIFKATILRRPIRFLGIPAIVLVIVGVYWWLQILDIWNAKGAFAIGNALVASVILLGGFFLGIGAIILLSITILTQETGHSNGE